MSRIYQAKLGEGFLSVGKLRNLPGQDSFQELGSVSRKDGTGWEGEWARTKGLLCCGEGSVLVLQAQTLQSQGKEPGQTAL